MDGETPSWLEGDAASPAPTPVPVPEPTSEPETFDLNEPAPSSKKTARAAAPTDNIAGSIMNNIKTTEPEKEVDESDLPKMIFIMRVLNLAAAGLLIAVSVRFFTHDLSYVHKIYDLLLTISFRLSNWLDCPIFPYGSWLSMPPLGESWSAA